MLLHHNHKHSWNGLCWGIRAYQYQLTRPGKIVLNYHTQNGVGVHPLKWSTESVCTVYKTKYKMQ